MFSAVSGGFCTCGCGKIGPYTLFIAQHIRHNVLHDLAVEYLEVHG